MPQQRRAQRQRQRPLPLPPLLLLAAAVSSAWRAGASPTLVGTLAELRAAAAAGGVSEVLLTSHLALDGTVIEVVTGSTLTLRGDAASCGPPPAFPSDWAALDTSGLCVIDAQATSAHLLVADGATLTLDGVALVNGATLNNGGSVCVGVCAPDRYATPDENPTAVGGVLVLNNSLLAHNTAGVQGTPAGVRSRCRGGTGCWARARSAVSVCRSAHITK
jgi:hypothetical protein